MKGALVAVGLAALFVAPATWALTPEPHFDFFPALPADVSLPSATPACAEDAYAFRVLYVVPPSTLDMFAAREPLIRVGLAEATGVVRESALPWGVDVRLKFFCDDEGAPIIEKLRVPTPPTAATFSTIVRDIRAAGYADAHTKYWVLYEGVHYTCGGCFGQGNIHHDDRPLEENANNEGAMYAITYVGNFGFFQTGTATLTRTMLHEASHTMGAVQHSAPHASGGWHCNDGMDVVCYADGGSTASYDATVCPRLVVTSVGPELPYDCGQDDYFHPLPPEGSYLATHWNVGDARNRYVTWQRLA